MGKPLSLTKFATACVLSILAGIGMAMAKDEGPRKFNRAREGVAALVAAVRANDTKSLQAMLGPQAEEIMLSRDPANAGTALDDFLARYDREHWINQQNPRR